MSWSDVTPNSSTWNVKNPTETVWDSGTTSWDLNGNVYSTFWDGIDNAWSTASNNAIRYFLFAEGIGWDGGALYWDLVGNVYHARWI